MPGILRKVSTEVSVATTLKEIITQDIFPSPRKYDFVSFCFLPANTPIKRIIVI